MSGFLNSHQASLKQKWPWFLVGLLCLPQALKGIDFTGYLATVSQVVATGFASPPYPVGSAQNGDFFQSPVLVLFLAPFTFLSALQAKLLVSLVIAAGLFRFALDEVFEGLSPSALWGGVFAFTHALSDVFLSLNLLAPSLLLLWFSHRFSLSAAWGHSLWGGLFFALALFMRPMPLLLIPLFLVSPVRRKVLFWTVVFIFLGVLMTFLFFPNPRAWWSSWLGALSLYSQAANVLTSTFQTPLATLLRLGHHFLGLKHEFFTWIEIPLGGIYWLYSFWLAFNLEKQKRHDLAFAVLLSCLYVSFSRIWASGFLYLLPLVGLAAKTMRSSGFLWVALAYALSAQWLWPKPVWEYAMSGLGLQGALLSTIILISWREAIFKSRKGTP